MSGVSRLLSKRDKHRDSTKHHLLGHHAQNAASRSSNSTEQSLSGVDPASAVDFYGLFMDSSKPNKDEESKIKAIKHRIVETKGVLPKDTQALWALRSEFSRGDADCAYDLLVAMLDASEHLLAPFRPDVKLRGAVNRQAVTCFLDATLFSMFSRLDAFEAMLYNDFDDTAREKLAFLLRLWVNLLRRGKLIPTDITKTIQQALAECGWATAKELKQQDASEAFTFITERLNLPLLTLKMDIYHTGKQDSDDHKFINERLLEVAIPTLPDGNHPNEVKLEDCLEEYFNNRIEVRRYLERRSTLSSMRSFDSKTKGGSAVHVEAIEVDPDSGSTTPLSPLPSHMHAERPANRHRAASIIQERFIPEKSDAEDIEKTAGEELKAPTSRLRKGSVRKEVLMPAWQFFSLIPWYTDNAPSSDAQVAAHFSSKRPVLGLCLKRYSYTKEGRAIRLNTFVDIPIEIGLPHFIQDDHLDETGPLYGNFKLSLQSVVCHRGNSVNSGHYISLARSSLLSDGSGLSQWLRFDDLASQRVTLVDIEKALKEETPYLLFYQILPVDGDPGNLTAGEQPPPYAISTAKEAVVTGLTSDEIMKKIPSRESGPTSGRGSFEISSSDDGRGRSPANERRPSAISFTEAIPPVRSPERTQEPAGPERRRSGPIDTGIGKTLSKWKSRSRGGSKEELPMSEHEAGPHIHVEEVTTEISHDSAPGTSNAVSDHRESKEILRDHDHRSRSRKRDKSRSRLMKTGKGRAHDPDRECIVM